jgi:uncharacterized membrane protein YfcA
MGLIAIGFGVGALGTLIGVGGGFMLIPILLYLYPTAGNVWITSVSLWLVAMNASSGSTTYYFKGKVHLRAAMIFCLASLPGSILGVYLEQFVSRPAFELVFGIALILYSGILLFRKIDSENESDMHSETPLSRSLLWRGAAISFFVGFIASFLGIGGGVIHVPLLAQVLGFPVHMATGTSHLILAISAWFTTLLHLYRGDIHLSDPILWQLGLSAAAGAQLGAFLSPRVPAHVIMRVLGVALALVGIRLVLR